MMKLKSQWTGLAILGAGIVLVVMLALLSKTSGHKAEREDEPEETRVVRYEFEIPVDSFDQEIIRIQPNQFLADILLSRGVNYTTIDQLARQSKPIFDVTRMKAGNRCRFFYSPDSINELKHLVYEIDQTAYVVYSFGDSLKIRRGEKQVEIRESVIRGEINSSPWAAMQELGASTTLAIELENIYAWTIDFTGLNKGDRFETYHENKYVDSTFIGIGKVFATRMIHGGKSRYAFLFEQDGIESYYNEEGESLKRAFRKAPLLSYRISSKYSNSRMHPVLRIRRPHHGVDYAAPQGTEILSIGDGKVVQVGYDNASGHFIKIKHNSVYTSGYLHLRNRTKFSVGQFVKQSEVIGYVGATGLATGPHLDFRIWKNGKPVDPLTIESPPVDPVKNELRPRFDSIVRVYREKLEAGERLISH